MAPNIGLNNRIPKDVNELLNIRLFITEIVLYSNPL